MKVTLRVGRVRVRVRGVRVSTKLEVKVEVKVEIKVIWH